MDIYKKTLEDPLLQMADYYDFHTGNIYHTSSWYQKYQSGDKTAKMSCTLADGGTKIVRR